MKKNKKVQIKDFWMVISIILGILLIGVTGAAIYYRQTSINVQRECKIQESLSAIGSDALSCRYKSTFTSFEDWMAAIKNMPEVKEVKTEVEEGKTMLVIGYDQHTLFSKYWADTRFPVDECIK